MGLWMSQEEEEARKKIRSIIAKRRKNRWTEIKQLAEELEQWYAKLTEARGERSRIRQDLAEKKLENLKKEALGQPEVDLFAAKKAVEDAEKLVKAQEKYIRAIEDRAKENHPKLFKFL